MNDRRYPKLSIRGPVTLFVIVLLLISTLTVLWNVVLVQDYQKLKALAVEEPFHWTFIALGSFLFLTIIVLSSILLGQLVNQIRWSQRQSNFISSVSHELNSPLSSIKLFAQTLRKPDLSIDDRLNFVGKILADVDRLQRLIANILRAAEMDYRGDALQVVTQKVELAGYLREFVDGASDLYGDVDLRLSLVIDGESEEGTPGYWVDLDRLMFRQVLDNLLDNAVRYRGQGEPEVELRLLPLGAHVELRVRDHGVGIPAEELPRLFERFYRIETLDPHQRRRKGTGIGLYVVRSIIHGHGGKVGARSPGPGHGATLWIRLPLIRPQELAAPESAAPESAAPESAAPESAAADGAETAPGAPSHEGASK